ncbi:MAG: RHS repeat-associated core domain-containing protein [Paludibacteraceae bacterium]|nr:RHS repeat-associated core domain-containing protein [Paludibacteraceae bacterium]
MSIPVTDNGEAVRKREHSSRVISYIPYGEIFVEQQSGGWQSPYLFNAKELDSETGLYYYGARYLDPSEAMWLSVDPLFEKYVGMSPYGYCAGNPVRLVDVDGEKIKIGNIVYIPGKTRIEMGKTPFEKNAILALNYLYNGKSEKVKGVIEKLCNTERYNITIQKSNESRVVLPYTETEQVLEWNDLGAIETDNGVKLSPANGLFHEMGHLDLHLDLINAEESGDSNAMESAMEREFPGHEPAFGPSYEILPVREYETEAAISNGEFVPSKDIKYTRTKYNNVRHIQVNSPISNDF